jgi:two-component system sensor histidine kinase UhpB
MSLRARVVALIGAVLLVSMLMGTLVAGYQAREALRAELAAGLGGARQTVNTAFEDLPHSGHPARDLRQLVATFDGNRHVRATLLTADGRAVSVSRTEAPERPAPRWFQQLLGPSPAAIAIRTPATAPGFRGIVLTPIAEIDVRAAWREFVGVVLVLSGSAAAGLVLVYLVIGAAFRPLRLLAAQFSRISTGDYSGRVAENGPSELLSLQRGFNHMASELAGTTERNRLLTDQLQTLQDEERADIARDLHDEIGPHLFAVNMDAEMIAQLSDAGRYAAIPGQVRAIQSAVGHMQRQVRELLGRLRPTRVTEFGLNAAIEDLVRFWAVRRPEIAFSVSLLEDEARVPEATADVVYRIVQEAANNAVRHGNPASIRIAVEMEGEDALRVSVADDGAGGGSQPTTGGLGLVGMGERVAAAGGSLTYGPNGAAPGWTTEARLGVTGAKPPRALASLRT